MDQSEITALFIAGAVGLGVPIIAAVLVAMRSRRKRKSTERLEGGHTLTTRIRP